MRRKIQTLVLALGTIGALGLGASAALAKPLDATSDRACPPKCDAVRCAACPEGYMHACITGCCDCVRIK